MFLSLLTNSGSIGILYTKSIRTPTKKNINDKGHNISADYVLAKDKRHSKKDIVIITDAILMLKKLKKKWDQNELTHFIIPRA
jgi:hypothetical protein